MKRKEIDPTSKNAADSAGAFLAGVFREFTIKAESESDKALELAALKVEATAKMLFRPSNAVSEEGLPPRVQTGYLRASITNRLRRPGASKTIAEVGTNVEYAPGLEYGTSRTRKHPFLRPALDRNVQLIVKLERDAIRKAAADASKP